MAKEIVAMILAGGRGSRLYALTQKTAKPAALAGMLLPALSRVFIDDVFCAQNEHLLVPLMAAMLLTAGYAMLMGILRSRLCLDMRTKLSLLTVYRFIHRLLRLPISFFEQRFAGDVARRAVSAEQLVDFAAGRLTELMLNLLTAVLYLVLLFLSNIPLTLAGIAGAAATIASGFLVSRSLETLAVKEEIDAGKTAGMLYSGLRVSSTLKASGAEAGYASNLLGYAAREAESEQRIEKAQQLMSAVPSAVSLITNILVLMLGCFEVLHGTMTAGGLTAFTQLLASFTAPVNELAASVRDIQTLKADNSRVEDIENHDLSPIFRHEEEAEPREEKLSGMVECRSLRFGYSPVSPPQIVDFSIKLFPGRTIALVGPSGCGKSTAAKLIGGLLDPNDGEILFDGIPLYRIPRAVAAVSTASVSQEITLFSGTIRENLTLWDDSVPEEDIVRAAKDACIHDTIVRLPGGYSFRLSEGGANLSGGERQRLEIARALVRDPSLLIMDEATSALDPITEKDVLDNIRRRGCSCVIAAHRLSAFRDSDEILVMERGKIVERGTHEELLALNGAYAAIVGAV